MAVLTCDEPLPAGEFESWWNSVGSLVEPANQRRGGESGVLLLQPRDPARPPLYCKRQTGHTYRTWLRPFGRPTILRELHAYRAFARLGIATPQLVYGAARRQQGGWQALLVTEALTGFVNLEQWCATHADARLRQAMWQELASTLARLHRAGWQHGCCYPKHLFVKVLSGDDQAPLVEIALLDLEKSRRRWRGDRAAQHDLGQLERHRGIIPLADLQFFRSAYRRAQAPLSA